MQPPRRVVIAALAITVGTAAAPPLAAAGKAPAILASLPDDTTVLAAIDLDKVNASPLATDAVVAMRSRTADALIKIKALGIDVDKDLDRAYFAVAGSSATDLDHARMKIVIAEGAIALDPSSIKDSEKTHQGIRYWTTEGLDVAVIAKRLYVVSDGHMPDVIDLIKRKVASAARSRAATRLRAAIGATTTAHDGWIVAVPGAADRTMMGAKGADVDWFSMSAGLRTDAVDMAVRIGMTTPAAATAMADATVAGITQIQASAGSIGLADLGKSLTVNASGAVVAVGATATKKEIGVLSSFFSLATSAAMKGSGPGSATP